MKKILFLILSLALFSGFGCKQTSDEYFQPVGQLRTDKNETIQASVNAYMEGATNGEYSFGSEMKYCSDQLYGYDDQYIYSNVSCSGYVAKNNGQLEMMNGSVVPTRLEYKQPNFQIEKFWQPMDGNLLKPTLQKIFPKKMYDAYIASFLSNKVDLPEEIIWLKVSLLPDLTISMPHSDSWASGGVLSVFDTEKTDNQSELFRFGRYLSDSAVDREYYITITKKENENSLPRLKNEDWIAMLENRAQDACPVSTTPTVEQIGKWKGVAYLYGGAKGCATRFSFMTDKYFVDVSKVYAIGKDDLTHTITPELNKIISSINEKK